MATLALVLRYSAYAAAGVICLYAIRQYGFTLNRLFAFRRHPLLYIDTADWPPVTVMIPARNDELTIGRLLNALLEVNYPKDRLHILPINDRSKDRTGTIIEKYASRFPGRIASYRRQYGKFGKTASLADAMSLVQGDIVLVLDAGHIPERGSIKRMVAPFFDPGVGAVLGCVAPWSGLRNSLAALLALERSGGYQIDQKARMNARMIPGDNGTVTAVRKSALLSIGGWERHAQTDYTDITFHLALAGWEVGYKTHSDCYEKVPEGWAFQIRQAQHRVTVENGALRRYGHLLLRSGDAPWGQRLNRIWLLGALAMPLITFGAWVLALLLYYVDRDPLAGLLLVLGVGAYAPGGNLAGFFEIGAATRLDRASRSVLILPLHILRSVMSLTSVPAVLLSRKLSPFRKSAWIEEKAARASRRSR